MKLLFIRHGTTLENLERRFLGVTDSPLCEQGIADARKAAESIVAVEHIYVSPMLRCRQTANILWTDAEQTVIDELRETDFGPFEGKKHSELVGDPLYSLWLENENAPELAGLLENTQDAAARASAALCSIVDHGSRNGFQTVGVISHGGTIMSILSKHVTEGCREYYGWAMKNLGGCVVETEPGTYNLHFIQDI